MPDQNKRIIEVQVNSLDLLREQEKKKNEKSHQYGFNFNYTETTGLNITISHNIGLDIVYVHLHDLVLIRNAIALPVEIGGMPNKQLLLPSTSIMFKVKDLFIEGSKTFLAHDDQLVFVFRYYGDNNHTGTTVVFLKYNKQDDEFITVQGDRQNLKFVDQY